MRRHWFKKYLPNHDSMRRDKSLGWVASWLFRHPYIWHWNRQSVARGVAAGLLIAFMPLPLQMVTAALLAFIFRGNVPIAIATTWITNPITFVPFNLLIYKTGVLITQTNGMDIVPNVHIPELQWENLGLIWEEIIKNLSKLSKSYFVGLAVVAASASFLGYCLVYFIWGMSIRLRWYKRKNHKKHAKKKG